MHIAQEVSLLSYWVHFTQGYFLDPSHGGYESGGYAVGTTRTVVVGIAVLVDIAEVVGVVTIRRTEPPPSGRSTYRGTPLKTLSALIAFKHFGQ